MPNAVCNFVTHRGPEYGSSLYYVTAHWVIRCSGNATGGRSAETFISHRGQIRWLASRLPGRETAPASGE